MNLFRQYSDSEYVDRVERTERFSRRAGCPILAIGIAYSVVVAWFFLFPFRSYHDAQVQDQIWNYHDSVAFNQTRDAYQDGLFIGVLLTLQVVLVVYTIVLGMFLLGGSRKNRLLVQSFRTNYDSDESSAAGQQDS